MSGKQRVLRRVGAIFMAIGAAGIAVWAINRGADCEIVGEVMAQMKRCGTDYANELRQMRFVPVALPIILFGVGLLMFTHDGD